MGIIQVFEPRVIYHLSYGVYHSEVLCEKFWCHPHVK